jgi:hypothetical protein
MTGNKLTYDERETVESYRERAEGYTLRYKAREIHPDVFNAYNQAEMGEAVLYLVELVERLSVSFDSVTPNDLQAIIQVIVKGSPLVVTLEVPKSE